MLDIRMKDENTSWQEWYEENPRPRKYKIGEHGSGLVYGFGVNDLDYISTIIVKVDGRQINLYSCRVYSVWAKMLARAYSTKWLLKFPTYREVCVSEEFLSAKYFSQWMSMQTTTEGGDTLQLDKDILYPGNKEYSPNTCVFVPQFLNMSLNICERGSGSMPKGVRSSTLKDGDTRYSWQVKAASGKLGKGGLTCKWEAHKEWQLARASVIEAAIEKYKLMDCYREDVVYAVKSRADKLRYDAKFGLETTRLP